MPTSLALLLTAILLAGALGSAQALTPAPEPVLSAAEYFKKARMLERSDVAAAARYYRRAARQGSGQAAARLAQIYCNGMGNVSRDFAEVLKWKTAAEKAGVEPGIRIERSVCLHSR